MTGGDGQLTQKIFSLYATEIKTKELKIHVKGLLEKEVYALSWLSPKFYLPDFILSSLTPGFYWYRAWLLAEPRSSGSWLLEACTRGSAEESRFVLFVTLYYQYISG